MVFTSAKAISASVRRFRSSSRLSDPKMSRDGLVGEGAVAHALDAVDEAWIGGRAAFAQHLGAEDLPFALALDRDQDVLAVLGAKHAVGRDRGMGETHALRLVAGFGIEQRHGEPVGHHVEHRDADIGAFAGHRTPDQRFQDRRMRGSAGGDIDDGDADARRAFGAAGDGGEAALGLDQQVIGLAMGIGAGVAIAGDGDADQPRIVLAQPLAGEAELVHRAGLEVLDQHVGGGDQLFHSPCGRPASRDRPPPESLPRLSQTK